MIDSSYSWFLSVSGYMHRHSTLKQVTVLFFYFFPVHRTHTHTHIHTHKRASYFHSSPCTVGKTSRT